MRLATKTLRDYQEKLVFNVCRATGDVLVEQPTGSGKTVQIVTLVAMHLGKRFTHAVIAAPQEQIEQGFVKRDYNVVAFPERPGVAVPSIQVPKQTILGARDSKVGSVKRVVQYLRQPGPLDHAFACTHAALNRLGAADLPADLAGKALFIDEAHHASADGLSQLVTLWHERGGQLFFFTATPYRGDGRPVKLDGMRTYRRSLAEHMAEGFAPRHLDSEIVALGQPGDKVTAAQFTGEEAPPASYFDALVTTICRRWHDDGKPKAIVRVPPMQGGKSGELVRRLTQAFQTVGQTFLSADGDSGASGRQECLPHDGMVRVLDATGTGVSDKQRFLAALKAEQEQTFASSTFDVMIGIQRVLEGTDWPLCSAVYCVGMPGSLNTVVQFLGRAMRLKGPDYPADQRDRAKLVFFVPCGGGSALADLSIDHSRHALLTCCFLADHEVGQEWIVTQEVRRGIAAALGLPSPPGTGAVGEGDAVADAENDADELLDPEIRAEIELAMANACEQIIQSGKEPTVGEVVQQTATTRPDLPEAAIQRVATEILAAADNPAGTSVRKAIAREIATRLRIDPKVKQAMTEAFAVVLEEFRDATLKDSAVLESVGRQVHGVTGGTMQEFARRLRDAVPRPLTVEQILAWADDQYARNGEWPHVQSGIVLAAPEEKWPNLEAALRDGLRGLTGGSSVARLLEKYRGVRNVNCPPILSEDQILKWADAHFSKTGDWPTVDSGNVETSDDETWRAIDGALRNGFRSLPGGSSLARLLSDKRGVRHHLEAATLTTEAILEWADQEFERTGNWPTPRTGPVAEAPGETWARINNALIEGIRGLSGGSSLSKLLVEQRGLRIRKHLTQLSERQIIEWVDAYHQLTGDWPNSESGPIQEARGDTWSHIDAALKQGLRGLDGGSSLIRFLSKHRGIRNVQALPDLTIEQILAWADAHQLRTGKWPRSLAGPIEAAPGETWGAVENALRAGLRGLPGGSSLAALLAEHRGRRHCKNTPDLDVDLILEWADEHRNRTGSWPKASSGRVEAAPDETWGMIHVALNSGGRGLPGGSSLAKLLAEHRGVKHPSDKPLLSVEQILKWIHSHRGRTGNWPKQTSGPIVDAPGENWMKIHQALYKGLRGLPGGSTLTRLIKECLAVEKS